MQIRNLDYIRQKDPRLFEALSDILQGQRNIAQQVNADPSGEPLPPPAIDSLKVTGTNGHFNVAIEHGGEVYRGVEYYVEHADNPQFKNAHTVPLGHSRNGNIFLGDTKRYFRAYAAYPTSKPGPPVYHGGAAEPMPVTGGGIVGAPALLESQGSGTGAAGEGLSGPGALPFRSSTGAPPVRGLQREAGGSSAMPSGSAAGLPSGAQVYTGGGGGGGSSSGAGGGAGPQGPAGPGVPAGGADGQMLVKASATDYDTEWIDPPTGGAGSFPVSYPAAVAPPALSNWAWVNQGGATASDIEGGILLTVPNSASNNLRILKKAAPTAPYTITAAYLLDRSPAGAMRSGIVLRESATGKLESWGLSNDSTRSHDHWNSPTAWVSGANPISAVLVPIVYIRVRVDADTLYFSTSVVGIEDTFNTATSHAKNAFFTAGPDEIGFGVDSESNGRAVMMYLFHWEATEG